MSSQSPPRKRQKKGPQNILHSKPFRVDLSQLYNSQSFETIPTNHSIINKPPSSQPSQGISAEWPQRGRTNTRGRASATAQPVSKRRSQSPQSVIDCDIVTDPTENVRSALKNLKNNGMIITIPGRYEFPRSVQPYIKNLVELEADKFIPMVLKSQIGEFIKASPKDISFFEQNWYGKPDRTSEKPYYEHPSTDIDTERMIRAFDALIEIQAMAKECDDDGKDENAWCQTVVLPLLRSALHKPDSSLWRVESVQTQTIETEFMPASISSSSGKSTDDVLPKMIDYAIFLNKISKDLDVVALYEAMKQVEGGGIGLWTDSYTNTLIPFAICAVKSEYAITMEGKVQLMTVAQAFLKYLEDLVIQASKLEIKDELLHSMPPVMGWTVHGHDWKFYICHRKGEQQIWADCSMGDGSTATPGKALRLLRVIEEIKKESGQQYVVWLKKVFNL